MINLLRFFRTQDPLSVAHDKVASALDVFTAASTGLQDAVEHFHAVEAEAHQVIADYKARAEEALAAREKSSAVLAKIEGLFS